MFLYKTYKFRRYGLEVYVSTGNFWAFRFAKVIDDRIHSCAVELDMRQPQPMRFEAISKAKQELKDYLNEKR